ncbi:MAG: hypothetical protein ACI9J2_000495 [Saprospiraceae bacterium]|jgi:hypothetical protein
MVEFNVKTIVLDVTTLIVEGFKLKLSIFGKRKHPVLLSANTCTILPFDPLF